MTCQEHEASATLVLSLPCRAHFCNLRAIDNAEQPNDRKDLSKGFGAHVTSDFFHDETGNSKVSGLAVCRQPIQELHAWTLGGGTEREEIFVGIKDEEQIWPPTAPHGFCVWPR